MYCVDETVPLCDCCGVVVAVCCAECDCVCAALYVFDACLVVVAEAVISCVRVLLAALLFDGVCCVDFVSVVVGGGLRLPVSV